MRQHIQSNAQRDGRILRQGNQNAQVQVVRYVTEGSFDTYMWQTVERKARFIGQLMRRRLDVRDIEDIGDAALSYAEVKALAAGDPRLIEQAQVDADLAKLERLARAWARNQERLRRQVDAAERHITGLEAELGQARSAAAHPADLRGERFAMRVGDRPHRRRVDAGAALVAQLNAEASRLGPFEQHRLEDLGELGGHRLVGTVARDSQGRSAELSLYGVPRSRVQLSQADLHPERAAGVIARLEHRLERVPSLPELVGTEIAEARREQQRARAGIVERFPQADALARARERSAQLVADLAQLAEYSAKPSEHDVADDLASIYDQYRRLAAEERVARVRAAITPGLDPDAIERVLPVAERAELAGADPTGLCARAGLGALREDELLRQITNQAYSARPRAAYAGILAPPPPSADPSIAERLDALGRQVETWRDDLAQRLAAGEPPPQWAAPLGPAPADPDARATWAAQVAQVGVWHVCRRLPDDDLYGPDAALGIEAIARARVVAAGGAAQQVMSNHHRAASLRPPAQRASRHEASTVPLHP